MIKKFLNTIDRKKELKNISFNYVYANSDKQTTKSKGYIYKGFEFYSKDSVDNKTFLENFLLDHLAYDENIINNLSESILCLETDKNYFIMFLNDINSYTIKYDKKIFTFSQMEVIIQEIINESIVNFIYVQYTLETFDVYILFYSISNEDNLEIEKYSVKNNVVSPIIMSDHSLKFKKRLKENKFILFFVILIIGTFIGNSIYLTPLEIKYLKKELYNLKSSRNTYRINLAKINKKININNENLKKNKLEVINMNNVIDFKVHYKTEIKKLF